MRGKPNIKLFNLSKLIRGVAVIGTVVVTSITFTSGTAGQAAAQGRRQTATALKHVATYGRGTVTDVALSPDGKTLAVDGSAGTWLYEVTALQKGQDKAPRLLVQKTPPAITYYPKRDIVLPMANPPRAWDVASDTAGVGGGGGGSSLPTGYGTHIAFSADSTKLLTGARQGARQGWLWDLKTGQGRPILANSSTADFNRDGTKIITAEGWWDIATQKKVNAPVGLEHDFSLSPDGKTAIQLDQQRLTLIDLSSGTRQSIGDSVTAAIFSADSRLLAVNYTDDPLTHLLEVASGKTQFAVTGMLPTRYIAAPFSPDGKLLALLAKNADTPSVQLWDLATQSPRQTLTLPDEIALIDDMHFSRDSRTLAITYSAANSNMGEASNVLKLPIVLWDVGSGKIRQRLPNDNNQPNTRIDYTAQDIALTVDATSVVRLWNISTGALVGKISGYGGFVQQIAFTPQNKLLVQDGDTFTRTVHLIDPASGTSQLIAAVFGGNYVFSPDGNQFTVNDLYQTSLALWHLQPRQQAVQQTIQLPDHVRAEQTTFSPDSRWLAVNTPDAIQIYETDKGTLGAPLPTEGGTANEIMFSPDNSLLAVRGPSGAQLWDLAAQRVILQADMPDAQLMRFSPDTTQFALVDGSAHISVWELATGSTQAYTAQCPKVKHIAFVPYSTELMIACDNQQISTINVMLPNVQQGKAQFTQFAASPDGKLFTFVDPDSSAFFLDRAAIWDSTTRKPAADVSSFAIAFSPDGNQVAVGSDDGTVDVWEIVR